MICFTDNLSFPSGFYSRCVLLVTILLIIQKGCTVAKSTTESTSKYFYLSFQLQHKPDTRNSIKGAPQKLYKVFLCLKHIAFYWAERENAFAISMCKKIVNQRRQVKHVLMTVRPAFT